MSYAECIVCPNIGRDFDHRLHCWTGIHGQCGGDAYTETVVTYLHGKYRGREPDIIVAARNGALEFVLQNRSRLFPKAPIVHMGIDKDFLDRLKLQPDAYGVPVADDVVGTVAQALKWHPSATRLVTVTGVAPDDQVWLARLRPTKVL